MTLPIAELPNWQTDCVRIQEFEDCVHQYANFFLPLSPMRGPPALLIFDKKNAAILLKRESCCSFPDP